MLVSLLPTGAMLFLQMFISLTNFPLLNCHIKLLRRCYSTNHLILPICLDPKTHRIYISRHVIFNETEFLSYLSLPSQSTPTLVTSFFDSTPWLAILAHTCCHNPIFTHGIFSGVGAQIGTARTEPARSDDTSPHQILPRKRSGTHFPRFDQV
jgi:hypothetical protein